ncbi:hypothetical protein [Micromonospora sp. NPDC004704]
MERTRATVAREQNGYIQLKGDELDSILEPMGHESLREKAAFLGVGLATIQSAYKGNPVGYALIYGCRTNLPQVAYERLFAEVQH